MMARLGFSFQIVTIVVVFLAALACASGDTKVTGDSGTSGSTGGTVAGSGAGGQAGSTTPTVTGGTEMEPTAPTGGTPDTTPVECGNNIAEDGEKCDGTDLADTTCDSLMPGFIGTISCAADCQNFDTSMCYEEPEETNEAGADAEPSYGG